jgi:L-ascorbate metabolism protein UlaG (beta-lactamase superfamily)
MRLKVGRPDLSAYADRFNVPAAGDGLAVTFLGVSTLLFDDGESAVLFDGFFSRPSMSNVVLGRVAPNVGRIDAALERLGFGRGGRSLDAVVPVHSHFDHALDSAAVAQRAGGLLVGGTSTANLGHGAGLASDRIHMVAPGEATTFGSLTLTHHLSAHCPPDRFPGQITSPVVPPAKASAYKCGEAWSIHVTHTTGRTALVQGSAGYVPAALEGQHADVAYLGIGQLGVQSTQYIRDYWAHTVRAVGARRAVLTHWDDFFRPLDKPLRALPYAADNLDASLSELDALAKDDNVAVSMPSLWRREDPWATT